jgi:hypothetical protein
MMLCQSQSGRQIKHVHELVIHNRTSPFSRQPIQILRQVGPRTQKGNRHSKFVTSSDKLPKGKHSAVVSIVSALFRAASLGPKSCKSTTLVGANIQLSN